MDFPSEIAILDFGSQYTHLIARRVRELGVRSHIYPPNTPAAELKHAWGIILSGGPKSVVSAEIITYDPALFKLNIPILGLCYGHQLLAKVFHGEVKRGEAREYGVAKITTKRVSPLFANIPKTSVVWMSHGDHVETVPPGFTTIAVSTNGSITAMENPTARLYGLQFHPEVKHSRYGTELLKNFVFGICQAEKNWQQNEQRMLIEETVHQEVKGKNVFLLVSGGVDSTVCFALLEKVLGKNRVYGAHIDHGMMRDNESRQIKTALRAAGFTNLHIHNAKKEFLEALKGVTEPEKKRAIIGGLFLDTTDRIMKEQGFTDANWILAQGTIYPDTIESGGTKHAVVIKTHHNRVPRIQQLIAEGKVTEPLKELYKDEVRALGMSLGLPKSLVNRKPFPGPGLAIRCLCEEKISHESPTLQGVIKSYIWWKLPIKSVGVQGDERTFSHPALLVPKTPLKTWGQLPKLSANLVNKHHDFNRVLLLVGGKALQIKKSSAHQAFLTPKRIKLLQQIDGLVMGVMESSPEYKKIWQFPVVLVPFGYNHGESIVLRPVASAEAMTANWAKLSPVLLKKIVTKILNSFPIDFVFYDLTNKPPGTIEWE